MRRPVGSPGALRRRGLGRRAGLGRLARAPSPASASSRSTSGRAPRPTRISRPSGIAARTAGSSAPMRAAMSRIGQRDVEPAARVPVAGQGRAVQPERLGNATVEGGDACPHVRLVVVRDAAEQIGDEIEHALRDLDATGMETEARRPWRTPRYALPRQRRTGRKAPSVAPPRPADRRRRRSAQASR